MNIIKKLKELNYPLGSYVVIGGGILSALGIREARDVDMSVTPEFFVELSKSGEYKIEERYGHKFLISDDVEISSRLEWEDYKTTTDEAIKSAEIIEGFPFLNINETIKFKKALGREKDFRDIELLEEYLKKQD